MTDSIEYSFSLNLHGKPREILVTEYFLNENQITDEETESDIDSDVDSDEEYVPKEQRLDAWAGRMTLFEPQSEYVGNVPGAFQNCSSPVSSAKVPTFDFELATPSGAIPFRCAVSASATANFIGELVVQWLALDWRLIPAVRVVGVSGDSVVATKGCRLVIEAAGSHAEVDAVVVPNASWTVLGVPFLAASNGCLSYSGSGVAFNGVSAE